MPIIFRDNFERLIRKTSQFLTVEDLELIRRAYEFTDSSMRQRGVIRLSGDPAIVHSMEVANKLADWQLDSSTIAAGLLHDVIEDPEIHHMQIRATFKEQVALLVEGVTKLKGYQLEEGEDEDVAYHVNMFLATASDIRVALIKLADRLHNMRTLEYLPASRRDHNCRETRELFIPLARFLGMERIQRELEDLTFRFSENALYERTLQQIDRVIEEENEFFNKRIQELRAHLRKKHPFSPIQKRLHGVYETFQLFRAGRNFKKKTGYVQIVVDRVEECYQVLGEVHALFQSGNASFTDTIHHPDPGLKRRLRTSLLDSAGNPFTVEILTEEMKRVNDDGIVPYFMAPQSLERTDFLAARVNEINGIFDAYQDDREDRDKRVFLEILSGDILKRDIYAITTDGRRVTLPVNSTALDFAYAEGRQYGDHFSHALVNDQEVGASHTIHSCDQVRIVTDGQVKPRLEWMDMINTSGAKYAIIRTLREQPPEVAEENGREVLLREVKATGLSHSGKTRDLEAMIDDVVEFLGLDSREDFYRAIGYGELKLADSLNALKEQRKRMSLIKSKEMATAITDHRSLHRPYPPDAVRMAKGSCEEVYMCDACTPLPGDEIEGYLSGKRLVVHQHCRRIGLPLVRGKKVALEWADTGGRLFPARIKVKLFQREDFYREMREIVGEYRSNILAARTDLVAADGLDIPEFLLEVPSRTTLEAICDFILRLKDVVAATRI